jgi:hypothetical protein
MNNKSYDLIISLNLWLQPQKTSGEREAQVETRLPKRQSIDRLLRDRRPATPSIGQPQSRSPLSVEPFGVIVRHRERSE